MRLPDTDSLIDFDLFQRDKGICFLLQFFQE